MTRPCAWALVLVLATSACAGPVREPAAVIDHAMQLLDAGSAAEAVGVLQPALQAAPNRADLRVALGRAELASGQPARAEISLRKAQELGAAPAAVAVPLAASLLGQGKAADALASIGDLEQQPEELRWPLGVLVAEAELQVPGNSRRTVVRAFVAAYRSQAQAPSPADRDARRASARLAELEATQPLVRDAKEHFSCSAGLQAPLSPGADGEAPNAAAAGRRVLQVGPTRALQRPSDAAAVAQDGDIIEIDAGRYAGDVALWTQNNLLLRGVGGRPHLDAQGRSALEQGTWVFRANDITVENVEFSGARAPHRNGSGIRFVGRNLTIRDSVFHDNEAGVLTWKDPASDILIERSVFFRNGYGDGQSHNIYIGNVRSFTLRFSHSHDAHVGHNVKSRAATNYILYNRITDEDDGDASYLIDLPEGGRAFVVGNVLEKGIKTLNKIAISFASERKNATGQLVVASNSVYNRRPLSTFVRSNGADPVLLVNNAVAGAPMLLLDGPGEERNNPLGANQGITGPAQLRFDLLPDSPLIDAGEPPPESLGAAARPEFEYVHPANGRRRRRVGPPDIGAYEFCGW